MSAVTNDILRERESDILRKKVVADTASAANRFLDADEKEGAAAADFAHEEEAARHHLDMVHKADQARLEAFQADERRFKNIDKLPGILDKLSGNSGLLSATADKVIHAASAAGEAIAHTASTILEKTKEAAEAVKEKVHLGGSSDKLDQVKSDCLNKVEAAKTEVRAKSESALEKSSELAADAKAKASNALEKTKETANAAWNKTTAAADAVKEKISAATSGSKSDDVALEKQKSETDWFSEGGNCQLRRATVSVSPAANNTL